jgi:protein-tyrosine phosphatase
VPTDVDQAATILRAGYDRALTDRVEIACGGGVGRTGTALAAWAIFDGLAVDDAVTFVRRHYHPRAVEVPWQRRFLRRLRRDRADRD